MITLQGQLASAEAPLTRLRNETRELLKQEAVLDQGATKDAAIAALCDLARYAGPATGDGWRAGAF